MHIYIYMLYTYASRIASERSFPFVSAHVYSSAVLPMSTGRSYCS